jgi:hypothetical protein
MDGRGGKIHLLGNVFLRISFCTVPRSAGATPCFSATTIYMANAIAAVEVIVMVEGADFDLLEHLNRIPYPPTN